MLPSTCSLFVHIKKFAKHNIRKTYKKTKGKLVNHILGYYIIYAGRPKNIETHFDILPIEDT